MLFIVQVAAVSWADMNVPETTVASQSLRKVGLCKALQLEVAVIRNRASYLSKIHKLDSPAITGGIATGIATKDTKPKPQMDADLRGLECPIDYTDYFSKFVWQHGTRDAARLQNRSASVRTDARALNQICVYLRSSAVWLLLVFLDAYS
jgi:hypothetical protein